MMAVVISSYRPTRAPKKKRKQPPIVSRIVTPAPLKPLKGPVIRLDAEVSDDTTPPTTTLRDRRAEADAQPYRSHVHAATMM
jgi:hypothetical protein